MKKVTIFAMVLAMLLTMSACRSEAPAETTTTQPPVTTASAPAETTKNPILDKIPETEEPEDSDDPIPTKVEVGNAEELMEVIDQLNFGELPADLDITLTADIDLTGYTSCNEWEPIYRYRGTFDGAGHTIRNLNWTFNMLNSGETNMPTADQAYSYVLENLEGALVGNRWARGTVAFLVLELDGGTVKDLTFADSSMTINCSYNKNYQMFFGAVVGNVKGGTISGVTLSNVDLTIPKDVNTNQAFEGYAAALVGRVAGDSTISNCSADANCKVDTSANVKFNTGKLIGVVEAGTTLTTDGCSSDAECLVNAAPSLDGLPYASEDAVLGGIAGGLIGKDFNQG